MCGGVGGGQDMEYILYSSMDRLSQGSSSLCLINSCVYMCVCACVLRWIQDLEVMGSQ